MSNLYKRNYLLDSPASLKCVFGRYFITKHMKKILDVYFKKGYISSFNWSEFYDHYVMCYKCYKKTIYLMNKEENE